MKTIAERGERFRGAAVTEIEAGEEAREAEHDGDDGGLQPNGQRPVEGGEPQAGLLALVDPAAVAVGPVQRTDVERARLSAVLLRHLAALIRTVQQTHTHTHKKNRSISTANQTMLELLNIKYRVEECED